MGRIIAALEAVLTKHPDETELRAPLVSFIGFSYEPRTVLGGGSAAGGPGLQRGCHGAAAMRSQSPWPARRW
jgi:hypothetical protein